MRAIKAIIRLAFFENAILFGLIVRSAGCPCRLDWGPRR